MYLQEALCKALTAEKHLKRKSWMRSTIYATETFIDRHSQGLEFVSSFGIVWRPRPEDILADDWEIVEPSVTYMDTEPKETLVEELPAPKVRHPFAPLILSIIALVFSIIATVWR